MEALKLLLTSDVGLLSLGAILFMIVMAIYLFFALAFECFLLPEK